MTNRNHAPEPIYRTSSETMALRLEDARLPLALCDLYLGELFRRAQRGDAVAVAWFRHQIALAEDYIEKHR